jgi:hypothetical protein
MHPIIVIALGSGHGLQDFDAIWLMTKGGLRRQIETISGACKAAMNSVVLCRCRRSSW